MSKHARRKSSRLVRMGTPLVGATFVAGSALAAASSQPTVPVASVSGDTTTDLPVIQDLRGDAADDSARGSDRSGADAATDGTDAAPTTDTPSTPAPTPQPTLVVTPATPAPSAPAFPPIEGCDSTIPDSDVANGELGDEHLCSIGEGHLLRPDAAAAFRALAAEYTAETGDSLTSCVTDSYRSYDQQVDLKERKPYLAARPGTSNHGWGLAIDLACGADSYSSDLYGWLEDNGDEFGWENPDWAQQDGSKPEPWHWEFTLIS